VGPMTFDSVTFLAFLPIVFVLYWALPTVRAQNAFLLAASYVFYGAWNWRYVPLIFVTSVIEWWAVARMFDATDARAKKRWLALTLIVNLGTLGVFKYLDWGIESFVALAGVFGFHPSIEVLGLVLPIGISFHTFQALTYGIDVYRGDAKPTRDPIAFLAFVGFFPQLVAGPIEKSTHLLPQFLRPRTFDSGRAIDGLGQMLYGLVLKCLVADRLAGFVDPIFDAPEGRTSWDVLFGSWAFAFQIYGDFAGYSHMAIGCARLFGFDLVRNFAYPYFSRSAGEFWHRWHMSLSNWFRDYVYIPLGGSRVSPLRARFNVFLVFLLSGIWHGAAWTFVAWGAYWGVLVALQGGGGPKTELGRPLGSGSLPRLPDLVRAVVVFHVACIGWIFFRSSSIDVALQLISQLRELPTTTVPTWDSVRPALLPITMLVMWEWGARHQPHGLALRRSHPITRVGVVVLAMWLLASFGPVETIPFIYFQF
jgi:D-alanyl-lipoteichoic acid acyltransferase DltB (MBOAT superfamily)